MKFDVTLPGMQLPPRGVIITSELAKRPPRGVDYAREAISLTRLAQSLAASPLEMIQQVTTEAMHLTGAPSSGFSLLVTRGDGVRQFEWVAMAGRYADFNGGTTPFDASPCGATLALAHPQLFSNVHRAFPEFVGAEPALVEGLVVPVYSPEGLPLGTIWVASHGAGPNFDAEDVRRLTSLAGFSGAALEALKQRDEARRQVLASAAAYRDAIASEGRKDDFLSALAHELRSPLNAILAATRVARGREENRERMLDVVDRQTRRMSALVEDLLDLTRIGRGLIQLRVSDQNLGTLVGDALEAVRGSLSEKDQRTVVLGSSNLVVRCDGLRMQQVLINLIDNASKFTPVGGEIAVSMQDLGGSASVAVSDNGAGLSEEDLGKVFALYTQGKQAGVPHGLGIGLALCRQLVELHAGTLTAESAGLGQGSSFVVTLPKSGPPVGTDVAIADGGFSVL